MSRSIVLFETSNLSAKDWAVSGRCSNEMRIAPVPRFWQMYYIMLFVTTSLSSIFQPDSTHAPPTYRFFSEETSAMNDEIMIRHIQQ